MRFIGNIDAKTDQKGRVFLPAAFRKILTANEVEGLILRRDVFQKCLVLYPLSVWNALVDAVAAQTHPFDRRGRENLRLLVQEAEAVSLDSDGRILIPRRYLEAAGISQEVRFIGLDDTIEIWDRASADNLLSDPESFAQSIEQMMNPAEREPEV